MDERVMTTIPNAAEVSSAPSHEPSKPGMAKKWLVAILVLTFAFVLMPFLLWYMTTFTRPLNDADLASYFADALHPRRSQHALSQIADRITSPNPGIRKSAIIWYPEVIKFSEQGSDELRVTAAWVMGQDNQSPQFHAALLKQLADSNPMVQRNAALSLVRFADPSGHALIAGMLEPYTVAAQQAGTLTIRLKPGDAINPGTLLAHIAAGNQNVEIRSEVPGTVHQWISADKSAVKAGEPMLLVDPSPEMVWESLRALYLVGQMEDLPAVNLYSTATNGMPTQIQQQAGLTAKEITAREVKK
jgi:biotin carboxyl carrier protein